MEPKPRRIVDFVDANNINHFDVWISGLRDGKGRGVIQVRINRLRAGNFGDCGPVGEGVHELVVDFGPGYRVYFGHDGDDVVLLGGGSKSTQPSDIKKAKGRWRYFNA